VCLVGNGGHALLFRKGVERYKAIADLLTTGDAPQPLGIVDWSLNNMALSGIVMRFDTFKPLDIGSGISLRG
jgi:hypothetical protein